MFFFVDASNKLIGLVYEQNDLLFGASSFSVHTNPGSISHLEEQPSPSSKLPSSHWYPILFPSPHISTHAPELASTVYPGSVQEDTAAI